MFMKAKQPEAAPVVSAARVNAIAARIAPIDYCDDGDRTHRSPRSSTSKRAVARTADGEEVAVVIRNISSTGLRVEYSGSRALGDRVLIVEPSLPLRAWAQVVWQGEGAGGLQIVEEPKD
jgi:hypothetical protein